MTEMDLMLDGIEKNFSNLLLEIEKNTKFLFKIDQFNNPEELINQSVKIILKNDLELIQNHIELLLLLAQNPGRYYNTLVKISSWFFVCINDKYESLLQIWGKITDSKDKIEDLDREGLISLLMILILLNDKYPLDKVFIREYVMRQYNNRSDIFGSNTAFISDLINQIRDDGDIVKIKLNFDVIQVDQNLIQLIGLLYHMNNNFLSDDQIIQYFYRLIQDSEENKLEKYVFLHLGEFYQITGYSKKIKKILDRRTMKEEISLSSRIAYAITSFSLYLYFISTIDFGLAVFLQIQTYLFFLNLPFSIYIVKDGKIPPLEKIWDWLKEHTPFALT